MQIAVVYRSKTGFTRQYAEWIAEELGADLYRAEQVALPQLLPYQTIIYGGGLYHVGINGVKLITGNLSALAGRRLVVFATGASPGRPEEIAQVVGGNFSSEQLQQIHFFYLRGGFDASKLRPLDRVLMALLKLKLNWKRWRGAAMLPDERGMLHAYDRPVSFVRRQHIAELVEYVREE